MYASTGVVALLVIALASPVPIPPPGKFLGVRVIVAVGLSISDPTKVTSGITLLIKVKCQPSPGIGSNVELSIYELRAVTGLVDPSSSPYSWLYR